MITTDHNKIREWAEERDGTPAIVSATKNGSGALLRIDFGEKEEGLEEISWDEFFKIFDSNGLAFLFQDESSGGGLSRFFKFVDRNTVDEEETDLGIVEEEAELGGNSDSREEDEEETA